MLITTVAMPTGVRKRLEKAAEGYRQAAGGLSLGGLLHLLFVPALIFGIIFVLDLIFGMMGRHHWITLAMGSAIMMLIVIVPTALSNRKTAPGLNDMARQLEHAVSTGLVDRVTLCVDDRHWFIEHEHGVIVLLPVDKRRTLYLDLSSVADDPRWERWWANKRIFRRDWSWFRVNAENGAQLLTVSFKTAGEAFRPRLFAQDAGGYDPDIGGDLFEWLGTPADGDLLDRDFDEIDGWLRARLPAMAA